jgi:hypothetical protein
MATASNDTQTWPYCVVWHDAAEAQQPLAQGCCAH